MMVLHLKEVAGEQREAADLTEREARYACSTPRASGATSSSGTKSSSSRLRLPNSVVTRKCILLRLHRQAAMICLSQEQFRPLLSRQNKQGCSHMPFSPCKKVLHANLLLSC